MENKLIILFVTAIVGVIVVAIIVTKRKKENFWGNPDRIVKVQREIGNQQNNVWMSPGTTNPAVPPRFSSTTYGSNIRYNAPDGDLLATGGQSQTSAACALNQSLPEAKTRILPEYFSSDHNQKSPYDDYINQESQMPPMHNALGEEQRPIVYDRHIFANQRSKLYGRGDPIRGDLAIMPEETGWFRPSVHPHIDLKDGAISVLAGIDNDSSMRLHALKNKFSGGTMDTFGGISYREHGVNLADMQSPQYNLGTQNIMSLDNQQRDVSVTAFP